MYEEIISSAADSLGDSLTKEVAKGSHSVVYFGDINVYKITEKKVMEKSERIHFLISASESDKLKGLVPKTVLNKDLGQKCLVVEEFKHGEHPEEIDGKLLKEIIVALSEAHKVGIKQVLTDFEGEELPASEYWNNQLESARKYTDKLFESGTLDANDISLVGICLKTLEDLCLRKTDPPKLVMIYKDVYPPNILVDEKGGLRAIVDWDSAMSGPVELEYAILWHRYPELWSKMKIDLDLDRDTFIVAGITQGLRFWKSFSSDLRYVDKQREALKRTLNLFEFDNNSWRSQL